MRVILDEEHILNKERQPEAISHGQLSNLQRKDLEVYACGCSR